MSHIKLLTYNSELILHVKQQQSVIIVKTITGTSHTKNAFICTNLKMCRKDLVLHCKSNQSLF